MIHLRFCARRSAWERFHATDFSGPGGPTVNSGPGLGPPDLRGRSDRERRCTHPAARRSASLSGVNGQRPAALPPTTTHHRHTPLPLTTTRHRLPPPSASVAWGYCGRSLPEVLTTRLVWTSFIAQRWPPFLDSTPQHFLCRTPGIPVSLPRHPRLPHGGSKWNVPPPPATDGVTPARSSDPPWPSSPPAR